MKPANRGENRRDRRLRQNQSGKRKVVVVIRERGGKTLPGVFASEVEALNFIRARMPREERRCMPTKPVHGMSCTPDSRLHRINHQEAYSLGGERSTRTRPRAFSSRMRRGEIGHHHHIAGPYLLRFAQEAAWREDHRRDRERDAG